VKNERLQKAKYIFWDVVAACSAYLSLYVYRKLEIEQVVAHPAEIQFGTNFYIGLLSLPIFWITIYLITGFYRDIYRHSRLKDLIYTFNAALLGSVFIFFTLMLDDTVARYTDYYRGFLLYFSVHFAATALFRLLLNTRTAYRIRQGKIQFNTLLIGSNEKAAELKQQLERNHRKTGHAFVGFVSVHNNVQFLMQKNLRHLGSYLQLPELIKAHQVEEVIIAIESSEHERLEKIVNLLEGLKVTIKILPDTYDIISGKVRMESLASAPLIEISHQLMPLWQRVLKRVMDIVVSLLVMLLCSPLFILILLITQLSDRGPAFYRQKRIGFQGREFDMIKFRSMVVDAEKHGPMLSSENDRRITPWGRIMRKYRLDELPQFWNVLRGQMSIVGPRPERRYYMEKIAERAPHYKHLMKVKPGITSWGMVKYGYAENVEEMIERMKFDIIYIENMNLFNDLKILIYTVLIVLDGRGK
jgi:exopolysaccharide biosynthesis polyprenyl glycosylphosphotransferase